MGSRYHREKMVGPLRIPPQLNHQHLNISALTFRVSYQIPVFMLLATPAVFSLRLSLVLVSGCETMSCVAVVRDARALNILFEGLSYERKRRGLSGGKERRKLLFLL
jgi:hypothetical protein